MAESSSRKRSHPSDDDDSGKQPAQKRVRFPKGKKVKPGDEVVDVSQQDEDVPGEWTDAQLAVKERALRRHHIPPTEEDSEMLHDISVAEMHYEDNETFVDDGIQIEPFNLTKEREEGYFDAAGNYVEYVNENEIKDAWLDNVEVDLRLAEKSLVDTVKEDENVDLSSQDVGRMKRRIADVLEPGETVLQALRRLKGTSGSKKEKMSAETKLIFDQLTEDAMKLMENGDYNVYEENQEVFQREAEGYERLAQARGEGTSMDLGLGKPDSTVTKDFVTNGSDSSNLNNLTADVSTSNDGDTFDMFAEDDDKAANPKSDGSDLVPGSNPLSQPSEGGSLQNDYIYDESSGYYYSSSAGCYYDPSSGLYCFTTSGQWYSYNEETGTYEEVQATVSTTS